MAAPCITQVWYGSDPDHPANSANVQFPINSQASLSMKTVYAQDSTTVKYYEYRMVVESVIYDPTETLDPEAEIERIRSILKTPKLKLRISTVGLGDMPEINIDTVDPINGPLPQEVAVAPFASNNAIWIKWEVVFATSTCPSYGVGVISNMTSRMTLDIDEDGDAVLSSEGEIEFISQVPQTANPTLLSIFDSPVAPATGYVNRGVTFKTTMHWEPNGRTVKYRSVASPIKSENSLFPGTRMIDITQEISSTLMSKNWTDGSGFYTWRNEFSGEINLPANIHRSYAWVVFLKILRQCNRRLTLINAGKLAAVQEAQPAGAVDSTKAVMIPMRIKIKEPKYSRKLSFHMDYVIVCSLDRIIQASGLFQRVNIDYPTNDSDVGTYTPVGLSAQWAAWQSTYNSQRNPIGYQHKTLPIIFSCATGPSAPTFYRTTQYTNEYNNDPDYSSSVTPTTYPESFIPVSVHDYGDERTPVPPEVSWMDFKQTYGVIENIGTFPINYLSPPNNSYFFTSQAEADDYSRYSNSGWNLFSRTVSGGTPNPQSATRRIGTRGPSSYTIRMRGSALRLGYPIQMPTIVSVAGGQAVRTGKPKWIMRQASVSADYPVYEAAWEVDYLLTSELSNDILSSLITNGMASQFI